MSVLTTCLGYPRIGPRRELKKALESFWAGKVGPERLLSVGRELRRTRWVSLRRLGVDRIPSNDFSLYDHVLDMAVTLGAIPERYRVLEDPLTRYFAMARGLRDPNDGRDLPALELTKWFDTNYHYLVPELDARARYSLDPSKILEEVREARALGIETRPVIIGPVSFAMLAKPSARQGARGPSALDAIPGLLPVYEELLGVLHRERVEWVQLDEPGLVLDLDAAKRRAFREALPALARAMERPKILLATYFEGLRENLELATEPAFEALHVDLARAPAQLPDVLAALNERTTLSLGVVDGRNVWRADLDRAHGLVRKAVRALGKERVWVAPSCSLLHVPLDLATEHAFDPELQSWLAFGVQKLVEVRTLADAAESDAPLAPEFARTRRALTSHASSPRTHNKLMRARVAGIRESMLRRSPYAVRRAAQREHLRLPLFPTTTIGSFPQTSEVRQARAAARTGRLSSADYTRFLREQIERAVEKQERIGLDVLVHGEFERSDMVEYFAERLDGFAITRNGWVQSYGSRCVKPPILYGDVDRRHALTVDWAEYAQSLTPKPMKAILTGPVTLLQWSFVRDDQPRRDTCLELALALRDEVEELEASGIRMIQVDEPAFREALPLRQAKRAEYLAFAVECFRLATSGVSDAIQIQTHMCYSEFGDILDAIQALDADVLFIETARSRGVLLDDFRAFHYKNELGPGVYDIHSPRVPKVSEVLELIHRAESVVPAERLWVNPDCGLKTREWNEVEAALTIMVEAARRARAEAERGV